MDHEGRLWWFELMICAVRTAHVKRPTWWGSGKTCSCAWQCCQAEARRWPPSGKVLSTPRKSAFGQEIESLLPEAGAPGEGGLGGRRRRRRWGRARPGDALAAVDGNGGRGRGGGFGALGGRGCRALGGREDGRLDLGDFGLAAGGGEGAGAGHHGEAEGAAAGEAGRGRGWVRRFVWVLLGHSDASAARWPRVTWAGRLSGRGFGTGLQIRSHGRRLILLMYNGAGACGVSRKVESVSVLDRTVTSLLFQLASTRPVGWRSAVN